MTCHLPATMGQTKVLTCINILVARRIDIFPCEYLYYNVTVVIALSNCINYFVLNFHCYKEINTSIGFIIIRYIEYVNPFNNLKSFVYEMFRQCYF